MNRRKSEATEKLEDLIVEFQREVIPALIDFSNSPVAQEAIGNWQRRIPSSDIGTPFKPPNFIGLKHEDDRFYATLIEEPGLDDSGIFDRIYMCILEEVKQNISVDGRTFFYPAMGHDWRIATVWYESRFIGVDPDKHLQEVRPNLVLIPEDALDIYQVRNHLEKRDLPRKADIILKGASFTFHGNPFDTSSLPPLPSTTGSDKTPVLKPPSSPPIPVKDYERTKFKDLLAFYLATEGIIVALSPEDITLCKKYLVGYKRTQVISGSFRKALQQWRELEERYTQRQLTGFWRTTTEPFVYTRA